MLYRFRVRFVVTLVVSALISVYLAFCGANGLYAWTLLVGVAYSLQWLAKNTAQLLRSASSYAFFSILGRSLTAFLVVVLMVVLAGAALILAACVCGYFALIREYFEAKAYDQLNP